MQNLSVLLDISVFLLFCVAVAVLLAVIIILLSGALAVGLFLNYKRTGSVIPSLPKLPRYSLSSLSVLQLKHSRSKRLALQFLNALN